MRACKRVKIAGGTYFFTVNLAERRGNDLLIRRIADLREAFKIIQESPPFSIDAIVILPDHLKRICKGCFKLAVFVVSSICPIGYLSQ